MEVEEEVELLQQEQHHQLIQQEQEEMEQLIQFQIVQ